MIKITYMMSEKTPERDGAIRGDDILGIILLIMGIFGFIMAILTYPW